MLQRVALRRRRYGQALRHKWKIGSTSWISLSELLLMNRVVLRATLRNRAMNPNNAFKPKPLRSTKHMAEKACHVFGSTTQFGLT